MGAPQLSAFRWVPPFARGLVRDLRVRWALEEAGIACERRLIGPADQASPGYRALQPFGQVPALEFDDGLALFESGAIVLHIAETSEALMPADPAQRARIRTWMFAALNTVEPPISMLNVIDLQPGGAQPGEQALRSRVVQAIETRLDALAAFLGPRPCLVGERFSAADLLTTTVLRNLRDTELVKARPTLEAYRLRCEDRPAFRKALHDQLADFTPDPPMTPG